VTADHAPRIAAVEKTATQKVGGAALWAGKYGALFWVVSAALRGAAKQWPEFAGLIDGVLGALPL
jgi:hypothetical protein